MRSTSVRLDDKLMVAIDSLIPSIYINRTDFLLRAIKDRLEKEGIIFEPPTKKPL